MGCFVELNFPDLGSKDHFFKHRLNAVPFDSQYIHRSDTEKRITGQAGIALLPCKREGVFYPGFYPEIRFGLIPCLARNAVSSPEADVIDIVNELIRVLTNLFNAVRTIKLIQLHRHSNRKPQLLHADNDILQIVLLDIGIVYHLGFFLADTVYKSQLIHIVTDNIEGLIPEFIHYLPCQSFTDALYEAA